MNKTKLVWIGCSVLSSSLAFAQGAAAGTQTQPKTPDPCTSGHEFATADCALTWHTSPSTVRMTWAPGLGQPRIARERLQLRRRISCES